MANKVFLIGDTHFGHRNVIKYCSRPFSSVEEMNETLIDNWNKQVRKNDEVFMMGDFALSGKDNLIQWGKRLNGNKYLIKGNHDEASLATYQEAGFKYVYNHSIIYKDFFILSHYPQFIQKNGVYANIFAHIHTNPAYKDYGSNFFCVSAERINYTPINFEEIVSKMKECEQNEQAGEE